MASKVGNDVDMVERNYVSYHEELVGKAGKRGPITEVVFRWIPPYFNRNRRVHMYVCMYTHIRTYIVVMYIYSHTRKRLYEHTLWLCTYINTRSYLEV